MEKEESGEERGERSAQEEVQQSSSDRMGRFLAWRDSWSWMICRLVRFGQMRIEYNPKNAGAADRPGGPSPASHRSCQQP